VPFIICDPYYRKTQGMTCSSISELIDLYPTLADLTGLKEKIPAILQGESLINLIASNKIKKRDKYAYTVTNGGKDTSIRNNRWRYTLWAASSESEEKEELYDHFNDP